LEYQALLGIPILNQPGIQVFASDLDDEALCKARKGRYPEAIEAEISPERLERFFTKNGSYYQVKEEVRKKVLFSNHSILRDPPFSRLDLISCRNVLIYLQRGMQHNVFQLFHYALRQESFLFLGTSESAEMVKELFRQLDKSHQIYQARLWQHEIPKLPTLPIDGRSALRRQIMQPPFENHLIIGGDSGPSAISFHIDALERFSPPSILIDSSYHIVHLSETAGRYLQLPRGTISSNLLSVVLFRSRAAGAQFVVHSARTMYDDGVRLRHCPSLDPLAPGPVAHVNPADAPGLGAKDGSPVSVTTAHGEGLFTAILDDGTPSGVVYVPCNQPGGAALGTDPVVRVKVVS
jgi:hypothetical protein